MTRKDLQAYRDYQRLYMQEYRLVKPLGGTPRPRTQARPPDLEPSPISTAPGHCTRCGLELELADHLVAAGGRRPHGDESICALCAREGAA